MLKEKRKNVQSRRGIKHKCATSKFVATACDFIIAVFITRWAGVIVEKAFVQKIPTAIGSSKG